MCEKVQNTGCGDLILIIYDMGWEMVSPEIYMIKVN